MRSIFSKSRSLAVYYGHGRLQALSRYRRVVLQAAHYTPDDLRFLADQGTEPLAYLSLGEDAGPSAPWHRPARNPHWPTTYVYTGHPAWRRHLKENVTAIFDMGFQGLLLDTLDVTDIFPEERAALLYLIADLRVLAEGRTLFANRGFGLLPDLAHLIDGVVFEAFSASWLPEGDCARLGKADLEWTAAQATRLRRLGLHVYALDYCDSVRLRRFARRRARRHGLAPLTSNRMLTEL